MPDKDTLTFTMRLHDPKERVDAAKSAYWVVADIPRADFQLSDEDFITRYVVPAIANIRANMGLSK